MGNRVAGGQGWDEESRSATAVAEQPDPIRASRDKPVVVTGASGFVGTHVCRMLTNAGWHVRALVRNPVKAAARLAHLPVQLKVGDLRDATYVREAMDGAGAVVHLAAIAMESGNQTYESTNTDVTQLVLDAAAATGATRFIHMAQNASDPKSPFRFLRSKGVAQDLVTASSLRWTVLRPSVIVGPEDEFVNVLARMVRITPVVYPLPNGGTARFQPIFVDDVAKVVRNALDDDDTIGMICSLGGPIPLTLRQIVERVLAAMQARRIIVGVPVSVMRPLIALAQRVLPSPPVTTGLLDLLAIDDTVKHNTVATVFKFTPTPFAPEELLYLRNITAKDALQSLFRH